MKIKIKSLIFNVRKALLYIATCSLICSLVLSELDIILSDKTLAT